MTPNYEITLKDIGDLRKFLDGRLNTRLKNDYDAGENYGIELAIDAIDERFQHMHKAGTDDVCDHCGLSLYSDIHERVES